MIQDVLYTKLEFVLLVDSHMSLKTDNVTLTVAALMELMGYALVVTHLTNSSMVFVNWLIVKHPTMGLVKYVRPDIIFTMESA